MAASEHEREILRELEKDLLADSRSYSPSRRSRRTVAWPLAGVGSATGLLLLLVGLTVHGAWGTCLGVGGGIVFGVSAYFCVETALPRLKTRVADREAPKT